MTPDSAQLVSAIGVEPPGSAGWTTRRRSLVPRDRLVSPLLASSQTQLVVINAPAGFGKTTLLAQWEDADSRPFARVSLGDSHEDPVILAASIATAIGEHLPMPDDVFTALHGGDSAVVGVAIPRMLAAVGASQTAVVITLDDVHALAGPTATAILERVADNLPPGSQLVLASRSKPPVHLARRRIADSLLELRSPDLAMTTREAEVFLLGEGVRLERATVEAIVARTEGWPAALALAAISLAAAEDPVAEASRFAGDNRLVSDYIREELIPGLPSEELEFLTQTSILNELSGEICDAVLEATGSASRLRRIADSNALLTSLDSAGRRFRCHSLLREMLAAELEARSPQLEHALHLRACRWYLEEAGESGRAIDHATAGKDVALAGALIWGDTGPLIAAGKKTTVARWLGAFTASEVEATPTLCLAQAALELSRGAGAQIEHWTDLAVRALEGSDEPDTGVRTAATLIRTAGAARSELAGVETIAAESFESLPVGDPWRSLCRMIEGATQHLQGHRERARPTLEEAVRLGGIAAPHVSTLALAQLTLLALDEGDAEEAADLTARFAARAELFGVHEYPTSALLGAVAGLVRARAGQTRQAAADVRSALVLLDRIDAMSNWYEAEIHTTVARTLILLDDLPAARAHLSTAGRLIRGMEDARVLREWIDQAWLGADPVAANDRWQLTPAELRLLHFLPTHLSLPEIAGELVVSVNTVKSQAQSIYRKLGVSSRADAVGAAEDGGLLARAALKRNLGERFGGGGDAG